LDRSALWLQCRPAGGHPRVRLFCLPHAGGGAAAFHSWNDSLPAFVQVCSVLLPGRERRFSEPPCSDMETLVDALDRELRPWLDIPYAVFGHSMGALLAFEWARRVHRSGDSMPVCLFLSGRRAPDIAGDTNPLQSLPDSEFVEELIRRYDGVPQELLRDPELMELFLPILRADIAVVESYRFRQDEPLDCPIAVFAGVKDKSVAWNELLAWKRQTSRRFEMRIFPGGHFYSHPPLLQTISATLEELFSHSEDSPIPISAALHPPA